MHQLRQVKTQKHSLPQVNGSRVFCVPCLQDTADALAYATCMSQ